MNAAPRVLILPGWLNSGPLHWQSRWQAAHGYERVEQSDWMRPLRGDWMARLDEVLLADERPAVLVAHSLGCHLVAHWASHSQHVARVRAALLVAPPDVTQEDYPPALGSWRKAATQALPFPTHLVCGADDPYASPASARALAQAWGSRFTVLEGVGHINAESGLGDWPQGLAMLQELMDRH
jgi:uncharacterized protein